MTELVLKLMEIPTDKLNIAYAAQVLQEPIENIEIVSLSDYTLIMAFDHSYDILMDLSYDSYIVSDIYDELTTVTAQTLQFIKEKQLDEYYHIKPDTIDVKGEDLIISAISEFQDEEVLVKLYNNDTSLYDDILKASEESMVEVEVEQTQIRSQKFYIKGSLTNDELKEQAIELFMKSPYVDKDKVGESFKIKINRSKKASIVITYTAE